MEVLALVYCNFLKEVRLGGWGIEGLKDQTSGPHATILDCMCYYNRLRALLYLVACASTLRVPH